MKKTITSILVILIILLAGCNNYDASKEENPKIDIPYYFIAIHNEPNNDKPIPDEIIKKEYIVLRNMVKKADEYNIKLTLMFSAQWADYITSDQNRLKEVKAWEKNGHEISAHHHHTYHPVWDGYTDEPKEDVLEKRKSLAFRENEKYIGTLDNFIYELKKINPNITSGCLNEEGDKSALPDEIIYSTCSGFANHGEPGTLENDATTANKGINDFITVGNVNGIERKWLTHYQTFSEERLDSTIKVMESMDKDSVWGSISHSSERESKYFFEYLEYIHSIDKDGKKSRTVSRVIEEKLIPEKKISDELINEIKENNNSNYQTGPKNDDINNNTCMDNCIKSNKTPLECEKDCVIEQPKINSTISKKCGDNICDSFEKQNPKICQQDCN